MYVHVNMCVQELTLMSLFFGCCATIQKRGETLAEQMASLHEQLCKTSVQLNCFQMLASHEKVAMETRKEVCRFKDELWTVSPLFSGAFVVE